MVPMTTPRSPQSLLKGSGIEQMPKSALTVRSDSAPTLCAMKMVDTLDAPHAAHSAAASIVMMNVMAKSVIAPLFASNSCLIDSFVISLVF